MSGSAPRRALLRSVVSRGIAWLLLVVALVALVAPAAAEAGRRRKPPDQRTRKAAAHFAAAEAAERRRDYRTAIEEYEKALKIAPHPSVHFNIGRDYEELGELYLAAEHLQRYLDESVAPRDRDGVKARVASLLEREGLRLLEAAIVARGGDAFLALGTLYEHGRVVYQARGMARIEGEARVWRTPTSGRDDLLLGEGNEHSFVVTPDRVFSVSNGKVREHQGDAAARARARAVWQDPDLLLARHRSAGLPVRAGWRVTVDVRIFDLVEVTLPDGEGRVEILLDAETHLPFRFRRYSSDRSGVDEYLDYRRVEGVLFAYRQRSTMSDVVVDVLYDEVRPNLVVPESVFAPPGAP